MWSPRGAGRSGEAGALPHNSRRHAPCPGREAAPTFGLVLAVEHYLEGVGGQGQARIHQQGPLLPDAVLGDSFLSLRREEMGAIQSSGALLDTEGAAGGPRGAPSLSRTCSMAMMALSSARCGDWYSMEQRCSRLKAILSFSW